MTGPEAVEQPKIVHLVFSGCDFMNCHDGGTNVAAEVTCRRCQQLMERIPKPLLDRWKDIYPIHRVEL